MVSSAVSIRSLFVGWPGKDPNPTVREAATAQTTPLQPEPDSSAMVMLPGDRVEEHPLYTPPNPFMRLPFSELKVLVEGRTLHREAQRHAEAALQMKRMAHSGHTGRF